MKELRGNYRSLYFHNENTVAFLVMTIGSTYIFNLVSADKPLKNTPGTKVLAFFPPPLCAKYITRVFEKSLLGSRTKSRLTLSLVIRLFGR